MPKSELARARTNIAKRTAHLSDEEFASTVERIVHEVRMSKPKPKALLAAVYRDSAVISLSEESLTLTS